jgi:hypothetical protein
MLQGPYGDRGAKVSPGVRITQGPQEAPGPSCGNSRLSKPDIFGIERLGVTSRLIGAVRVFAGRTVGDTKATTTMAIGNLGGLRLPPRPGGALQATLGLRGRAPDPPNENA